MLRMAKFPRREEEEARKRLHQVERPKNGAHWPLAIGGLVWGSEMHFNKHWRCLLLLLLLLLLEWAMGTTATAQAHGPDSLVARCRPMASGNGQRPAASHQPPVSKTAAVREKDQEKVPLADNYNNLYFTFILVVILNKVWLWLAQST